MCEVNNENRYKTTIFSKDEQIISLQLLLIWCENEIHSTIRYFIVQYSDVNWRIWWMNVMNLNSVLDGFVLVYGTLIGWMYTFKVVI